MVGEGFRDGLNYYRDIFIRCGYEVDRLLDISIRRSLGDDDLRVDLFPRGESGAQECLMLRPFWGAARGGWEFDIHADDMDVGEYAHELIDERAICFEEDSPVGVLCGQPGRKKGGLFERFAAGYTEDFIVEFLKVLAECGRAHRTLRLYKIFRPGGRFDEADTLMAEPLRRITICAIHVAALKTDEGHPLPDVEPLALRGAKYLYNFCCMN